MREVPGFRKSGHIFVLINLYNLHFNAQIAVDSIENIRTVAALGVEDNFFAQFKENVKRPYQ